MWKEASSSGRRTRARRSYDVIEEEPPLAGGRDLLDMEGTVGICYFWIDNFGIAVGVMMRVTPLHLDGLRGRLSGYQTCSCDGGLFTSWLSSWMCGIIMSFLLGAEDDGFFLEIPPYRDRKSRFRKETRHEIGLINGTISRPHVAYLCL